jgi:NADPH:quinone reductase-like Zn-dependent oxidoreductase
LVRSIGADQVIDYTQQDFTKSGHRYDLILDAVGNRPLSAMKRILSSNGILVMAGGEAGRWMIGPVVRTILASVLSRSGSQKFVGLLARSSKEDLTLMHDLMANGKLTPVIDRRYKLNEVPEAIRYLEEGHARGKVVISLEDSNKG